MIVMGLASVIIGEGLFRPRGVTWVLLAVVGSAFGAIAEIVRILEEMRAGPHYHSFRSAMAEPGEEGSTLERRLLDRIGGEMCWRQCQQGDGDQRPGDRLHGRLLSWFPRRRADGHVQGRDRQPAALY